MEWKKIIRYPFLLFMIIIIMACSILFWIIKDIEFSELENRNLKQMPKFTLERLLDASFTSEYETYVNEQFPWRNQWITCKANAEKLIGKQENNGIIVGKDNYLFSKKIAIEEKQPNKNIKLIQLFSENLNNQNQEQDKKTKLTVSIVPNSYGILTEQLPIGTPNINQKEYLEQYKTKLNLQGEFASYLDVSDTLEAHKKEDIYYHTDHHWTTLGAYYAYEAFCKEKGMAPVSFESIEKKERNEFYGTYYSKYRASNIKGDIITLCDIPIRKMLVDKEEKDSLYDTQKLNTRDKYAAFLYGNHAFTVIKSDSVAEERKDKKILVIKDSYANSMIPYLTYHYGVIFVVDLRFYKEDILNLIKEETIEDVWILYNFDTFVEDNHFYRLQSIKS